VAIFRCIAPASVIVEVIVTDDVRRDVAGGSGMVGVAVAIVTPAVEVILVRAEALNVGVELINASERAGFRA